MTVEWIYGPPRQVSTYYTDNEQAVLKYHETGKMKRMRGTLRNGVFGYEIDGIPLQKEVVVEMLEIGCELDLIRPGVSFNEWTDREMNWFRDACVRLTITARPPWE